MNKSFDFAALPPCAVMGIINITPDSFSDGGSYFEAEKAYSRFTEIAPFCDIIDIGAMSTRPGSSPVTASEELARLKPFFEKLTEVDKQHIISVDTVYPETARFALENGAAIINDTSGKHNDDMMQIVKKTACGYIIMHNGFDKKMSANITEEVSSFFADMLEMCENYGIPKSQICFDAGFGFGKTTEQNTELLQNTAKLKIPGCAYLVALSRKRFLGEIFKIPEPAERDDVTLIADIKACVLGADIVRTHEVEKHKKYLSLLEKL